MPDGMTTSTDGRALARIITRQGSMYAIAVAIGLHALTIAQGQSPSAQSPSPHDTNLLESVSKLSSWLDASREQLTRMDEQIKQMGASADRTSAAVIAMGVTVAGMREDFSALRETVRSLNTRIDRIESATAPAR